MPNSKESPSTPVCRVNRAAGEFPCNRPRPAHRDGDCRRRRGDAGQSLKRLALLAAAGILSRRKDGQSVYYGMKDKLAVQLCELVRANLTD